jgi:putative oxidoreductase
MTSKELQMFGPLPLRIMAGIAFIVAGLPKFENISANQGFFDSLGLPPELVLPIALLEVIGGILLIVGVLTRITVSIFVLEMIGATLVIWSSQSFAGGPLFKQAGILASSLLLAISISLLLIGPGRMSIEWDVLKREIFPRGKTLVQKQRENSLERILAMIDWRHSFRSSKIMFPNMIDYQKCVIKTDEFQNPN